MASLTRLPWGLLPNAPRDRKAAIQRSFRRCRRQLKLWQQMQRKRWTWEVKWSGTENARKSEYHLQIAEQPKNIHWEIQVENSSACNKFHICKKVELQTPSPGGASRVDGASSSDAIGSNPAPQMPLLYPDAMRLQVLLSAPLTSDTSRDQGWFHPKK